MATAKQYEILNRINAEIEAQRKLVYDENMGIPVFMYPSLPLYKTINDIVRDFPDDKEYNIILTNNYGGMGFDSFEDMIATLKININKDIMWNLCRNHIFQGFQVITTPEIQKSFEAYMQKFE